MVIGTPQGDADQQRVVALMRGTIVSKLKAFGKFDAANKRGQRLFVEAVTKRLRQRRLPPLNVRLRTLFARRRALNRGCSLGN